MSRLNLKNIIGKRNEAVSFLTSLIDSLNTSVCIKDDAGKILLGEDNLKDSTSYPIKIKEDIIGTVTGDEKALVIVQLINHLVQKELEKKKLGAEVLNLYQEINLIFNFSEKLAQTIDASSICTVTLSEAKHVITSDHGVIVLWDGNEQKLQVYSSYGESFFSEEIINKHVLLLRQIVLSGQSEIVTDTTILAEAGIVSPDINSVIYSALKVNHRVMGAIILGSVDSVQYTAADLKLLTTLALQSSAAIESALLYKKNLLEAKEREEAMRLIYEATGKFVPYEFIGSLGHKVITDIKLGDQVQKIVTVLFSDIRDYTTLSEHMSPEENFKFVCSFNERIGPAIRKNKGFINQYLGDAIMAIFPNNASDALRAAIQIQEEVKELNNLRIANNQLPIQVGVGMHTGPLVMGITGDKDRMDATTISDTVNTASRVEGLTKYYKSSIILSEASLLQMEEKESFDLRYLGLVQLKGKHEPLHIHECFSCNSSEEILKKKQNLRSFNKGIDSYINKSFQNAVQEFESITITNPEDHTVVFLLENAKKNMQKGVAEDWNGVVEMGVK